MSLHAEATPVGFAVSVLATLAALMHELHVTKSLERTEPQERRRSFRLIALLTIAAVSQIIYGAYAWRVQDVAEDRAQKQQDRAVGFALYSFLQGDEELVKRLARDDELVGGNDFLLGYWYYKRGIPIYLRYLQLNGADSAIRAEFDKAQSDLSKAHELFTLATTRDKHFQASSEYMLGHLERAWKGNPVKAEEHYRKSIEIDPSYGAAEYGLAIIQASKRQFSSAIDNISKAASKNLVICWDLNFDDDQSEAPYWHELKADNEQGQRFDDIVRQCRLRWRLNVIK